MTIWNTLEDMGVLGARNQSAKKANIKLAQIKTWLTESITRLVQIQIHFLHLQ